MQLEVAIIEKAQSEWASLIVLLPEKDETLQFRVKYWRLNAQRSIYTKQLPVARYGCWYCQHRRCLSVYSMGHSTGKLASVNRRGQGRSYINLSPLYIPLRSYAIWLKQRICYVSACAENDPIWNPMKDMSCLYRWQCHLFQDSSPTRLGHQRSCNTTLQGWSDPETTQCHFSEKHLNMLAIYICLVVLLLHSRTLMESRPLFSQQATHRWDHFWECIMSTEDSSHICLGSRGPPMIIYRRTKNWIDQALRLRL